MGKKEIIRVTEDELREMVQESVAKAMGMYGEETLRIEDYFDVRSITRKMVMSIATDLRVFLQGQGFGSPLSSEGELLVEDVNRTLSIKELRVALAGLGFKKWQIRSFISYNKIRVVLLYADLAKNTDVIINAMTSFGWSKAAISAPTRIEGVVCRAMSFDPMEQKTATKEARRFSELYHWTPSDRVSSVMSTGIEPRSENEFLSYPPKAHLMKGNISQEKASYLGWQLFRANSTKTDGKYTLIKVVMARVPQTIEFYGDPRYEYGFFTKEAIPPSALEIYGQIVYTDKMKYHNERITFV